MSRFDADFAAGGLPDLMYQFGQSAVYSPIDGPPVTLTKAIFSPERVEPKDAGGIVLNMRKREVTISRDPDSAFGGVANVSTTATVTVDGEIWPIVSIQEVTDAYTIAALERPEGTEHAYEGYRGPM